jgi:Response regulator containing CheY-like receiver, AAA-type ATPase, and DNA-binding domains
MAKKINKKVLIVEDDKDFLSILKTKFTGEGFSVVTAEDGQEGINAVKEEKPDLIFSDVLMPGMDGIEMAKKIREFDKNVLIVFLTNIKDVDYTKNVEGSGEFDYLIKSDLSISDIVGKAKSKLGLDGSEIPVAPKKEPPPANP